MGLMDKAKEAAAQQQAVRQQSQEAARGVVGACPGDHYLTEVNRGSINMGRWQSNLNGMYQRGYRLAHVLEQDGNTVQVFEHHFH